MGAAGGCVPDDGPAALLAAAIGFDAGSGRIAAAPVLTVGTAPLLPAAAAKPGSLDGVGCPPQPNNSDTSANGAIQI
jgi:hypothetical protein